MTIAACFLRKTGGDVFSVDEIEVKRLESPNTSSDVCSHPEQLAERKEDLERARRAFQPSAIFLVGEQGE